MKAAVILCTGLSALLFAGAWFSHHIPGRQGGMLTMAVILLIVGIMINLGRAK